jgi:hypothetical protein
MAALDAAWAVVDTSDDPVEIAKARDKAKRLRPAGLGRPQDRAMVPQPKTPESKPRDLPGRDPRGLRPPGRRHRPPLIAEAARQQAHDAGKPPAAQALAMQAALKKLKRR